MNDDTQGLPPKHSSVQVSLPSSESDCQDARLRNALSAPDGVAERLVRKALRANAPEAHPGLLPARAQRRWIAAATTALCLALLWGTSPLWRSGDAVPEPVAHLAEVEPTPAEETPQAPATGRHLRLSNTGDVVQLTAPSGNTLLIVAAKPTSRR